MKWKKLQVCGECGEKLASQKGFLVDCAKSRAFIAMKESALYNNPHLHDVSTKVGPEQQLSSL